MEDYKITIERKSDGVKLTINANKYIVNLAHQAVIEFEKRNALADNAPLFNDDLPTIGWEKGMRTKTLRLIKDCMKAFGKSDIMFKDQKYKDIRFKIQIDGITPRQLRNLEKHGLITLITEQRPKHIAIRGMRFNHIIDF